MTFFQRQLDVRLHRLSAEACASPVRHWWKFYKDVVDLLCHPSTFFVSDTILNALHPHFRLEFFLFLRARTAFPGPNSTRMEFPNYVEVLSAHFCLKLSSCQSCFEKAYTAHTKEMSPDGLPFSWRQEWSKKSFQKSWLSSANYYSSTMAKMVTRQFWESCSLFCNVFEVVKCVPIAWIAL